MQHESYKVSVHSNVRPRPLLWIWKNKCIPRLKFFMWLLLNDSLNTRNILKRRKTCLQSGYYCVLCSDNVEEMMEHLFLAALLAHPICIWYSIGLQQNLELNLTDMLMDAEGSFQNNFLVEGYTPTPSVPK